MTSRSDKKEKAARLEEVVSVQDWAHKEGYRRGLREAQSIVMDQAKDLPEMGKKVLRKAYAAFGARIEKSL